MSTRSPTRSRVVVCEYTDADLEISPHYVLDEALAPADPRLAVILAALFAALGAVVLVGLAGRYLIYRRTPGVVPAGAATLAPGERLPLRVTGDLRTPARPDPCPRAGGRSGPVRGHAHRPAGHDLDRRADGTSTGDPARAGRGRARHGRRRLPVERVASGDPVGRTDRGRVALLDTAEARDRAAAELLSATSAPPATPEATPPEATPPGAHHRGEVTPPESGGPLAV